MKSGTSILVFVLALLIQLACILSADGITTVLYHDERNNLIQLRDSLIATVNLHSNWTGPPCYKNQSRWIGIKCLNWHVVGIVLEDIQLTGSISPIALQNITYLVELNLRNNALHGPLPSLKGLIHLQLVLMSHNRFSGSIPIEFTELSILTRLELQDNLLNGTIPPFNQQTLTAFNVSYNFLKGSIPETSALEKFSSSSYDHNLELCGKYLDKLCPTGSSPPTKYSPPPSPPKESKDKSLEPWSIASIALAAVVVTLFLMLFLLGHHKRIHRKRKEEEDYSGGASVEGNEKNRKVSANIGGLQRRTVELDFFDWERPVFDLHDLLRSSAVMMGKGRLGTTYKTILEFGPDVIVKRVKEMNGLTKKEFVQHMQLLGQMRHDSLVKVITFYYSEGDKLVISEYVPGWSLFELLHDKRVQGRVPLNWTTRLSIVKGMARGLAYLHQCLPSHKVPHGNLKSSNVIIHHKTHHPKLTDFGFQPLLPNPNSIRKLAIGKSPEFSQGKQLTHKGDVYCFGLLVLEVITGRIMPSDSNSGDLSEWVRLDLEILASKEGYEEEEMARLAEIALECTDLQPERRPKMSEVIKRIEEIKVQPRE